MTNTESPAPLSFDFTARGRARIAALYALVNEARSRGLDVEMTASQRVAFAPWHGVLTVRETPAVAGHVLRAVLAVCS